MTTYSPREFGKLVNRTTLTLQRWDKSGKLKAFRTPTNRRFYTREQYLEIIKAPKAQRRNVVYYRVSSANQKTDLASQKAALEVFCQAQGLAINDWVNDIGSGLNYKRKNFNKILADVELGLIDKLVIAHRDRLVRFGFDWFKSFCESHATELVIMNNEKLSPEQEMIEDLMSIVHVFSSRFYGLRKYKKEIKDLALTVE
jgi:putative resolvase